jgi:hypothetical protein
MWSLRSQQGYVSEGSTSWQAIRDLELISQVYDSEDLRHRVEYLSL